MDSPKWVDQETPKLDSDLLISKFSILIVDCPFYERLSPIYVHMYMYMNDFDNGLNYQPKYRCPARYDRF